MEIAKIIDHTFLRATASKEDIKRVCQQAKDFGFRGVCIPPKWVKLARSELKNTKIKLITVVDWPHSLLPLKAREFEAKLAKKDGADEIDPVMDLSNFKMGDYEIVLKDLKTLAKILPCKVIIETGYLSDKEIKIASNIVKESGAICVKTSTGKDPKVDLDKKAFHVKLMREAVGPDFLVKAAGGIRTYRDLQKMVSSGADIIGTSSGVEIVKGGESG